ncbi:TPA: hypothetical protein N0F65_012137 [Lagenidium giganteum]|uniref:Uncharacterized protein n=1 Tax=Lagenidium giganteum TaxID=4803 RepID=A0AAV2YNW5_9STRA|nr:TPA: hypothetical protein N0F65_012137 [Lagenidium giganteum]
MAAHVKTKDPLGFCGSRIMRTLRGGAVECGWLTRYDDQTDSYRLFVPGTGVTVFSRGDVMSFISKPGVELRTGDDPEYPVPVEDTTNRYVGVPMIKRSEELEDVVAGKVAIFLPFDDLFRVVYEDDTTADVDEDTIINSMIHMLTHRGTVASSASTGGGSSTTGRKRKARKPTEPTTKRIATEPPAPPKAPSPSLSAELVLDLKVPLDEPMLDAREDSVKPEPVVTNGSASNGSSSGSASPQVVAAMTTPVPLVMTDNIIDLSTPTPADEEFVSLDDMMELVTGQPADKPQTDTDISTNGDAAKEKPFYLIEKEKHAAVDLLERRSEAYGFVRQHLLTMLDSVDNADSTTTTLQRVILLNEDIKDREALLRFMETKGLEMLNTCIMETMEHCDYDTLLVHMKIIAMLPPPSRSSVIDSQIGISIGRVARNKMEADDSKSQLRRAARPSKKPVRTSSLPSRSATTVAAAAPEPEYVVDSTPIPRLPKRSTHAAVPSRSTGGLPPVPPPPAHGPQLGRSGPSAPTPAPVRKGLKPDWMRTKENLSKTRFSIQTNADAEFQHYRRDHSRPIVTNSPSGTVPGTSASVASGVSVVARSANDEPAGERGVFGRAQKLSFGPRWSTTEFYKDAPPNAVRRDYSSFSNHQPTFKPILRKTSKYSKGLGDF